LVGFYVASANNGEQLHDPSEEALADLLRRLGRAADVRLNITPVSDDSSWDLGVHGPDNTGKYWLFWRDFVLARHSAFESTDPAEVAQRITHLVRLSADARKSRP
jgi:hypothetical protein